MNLKSLEELIAYYGINRVCHFAPFRNLHQIVAGSAILSSERVAKEFPGAFNPTDPLRLDNKRSHVCATIEYPNVWYLDKLEKEADLYPNYAVFLLSPAALAIAGTLFCVRNAAGAGAGQSPGPVGMAAMYAPRVVGKRVYSRTGRHPKWLPTDMQAEILIPDAIPLELVTGVLVKSNDVAATLVGQLSAAKTVLGLPIYVSPETFDKNFIAGLRTGGPRPHEELYQG